MVKRCIGIDIGSSCLRAVQVSRTGEHFNIEKVFSIQTRRDSDSPPEILRSLTSKYGFDRRADVAISMPNDAVFYRNLETDVTGLEQICGLSKRDSKREKESASGGQTQSVLEHNFPIEPDEIVAQVCSYSQPLGDKYSVLVSAVKRASLHERMNILAEAKMHPNLVEAAIFAVHSAIAVNHPEIMTGQAIIAYIDESYLTLALLENNSILLVRNIPISSCSDKIAIWQPLRLVPAGRLSLMVAVLGFRSNGASIAGISADACCLPLVSNTLILAGFEATEPRLCTVTSKALPDTVMSFSHMPRSGRSQ